MATPPCTLGSNCVKAGLSEDALLSYLKSKTKVPLPEIQRISNGIVLELIRYKEEHGQCTYRTLYCWIQDLFGEKWPDVAPTLQAFTKSIERLKAKFCKLKKQHNGSEKDNALEVFLTEGFTLPRIGLSKGRVLHFSPTKQVHVHVDATECPKTSQRPDKTYKEMQQKMYAVTRNANKKIKRRDAKIEEQQVQISSQKKVIKKYVGIESKLTVLKAELSRVTHRASYWKSKAQDIKGGNTEKVKELHKEIGTLKQNIAYLDQENAKLMDEIMSSEEITTFEGGKYTDNVRACVYELLSLNVGSQNVAPAIRCVIKNLTQQSIGRLPSYTLTCQMIVESLAAVQAQLGEKLSQTEGYTTLQSDGTTKFGHHYAAFDVSVPNAESSYTLGLRHVFSGSAKDTLETFKEILDDLDSVQLALGKESLSGVILSKIKNTMSDRHAAEKLFNELLEDYRKDILPLVTDNWGQLSEVERDQLTTMNNFFCGLHFLVGLADSAEEVMKQWEAQSENKPSEGTSGTQRLVRTACKAFHHRGSQQCGQSLLFRTYLRKQGLLKIPLAQFVGNRFNILFYDAAGVFFLRNHMQTFIETVQGREANRLLKAVLSDLKNPLYISGCRALGLIDKVVTGPLWRKIKDSSVSVLDMSSVYCELLEKFDSWSESAQSVVEGSATLQTANLIHVDETWGALIAEHESNVSTQEVLQLLFKAFSITTQRLLIDHLPGGAYSSVTDEATIHETASVPTTNVAPERDFAILDRVLREKPNASLVALEALILFSHNKTSKWLEQQEPCEREKLFKAARLLAPSIKERFKVRRAEIQRKHEEALRSKQLAIEKKLARELQEKERLTNEITKIGLWSTQSDTIAGLAAVKTKSDKVRLLKLQINFRHKVLGQTHSDKSVFRFSRGGKQFSVDQLQANLYELLHLPACMEREASTTASLQDALQNPVVLVGLRIRHRFEVAGGQLVWYNGTVQHYDQRSKEFIVLYDGEDETCSFPLLEDISTGDLQLLSDTEED